MSEHLKTILNDFANQSDLLFENGIIRTDSFAGEIGEYIARAHFGLESTPRSSKGIDAVSSTGERYQIKAKTIGKTDSLSITIVLSDPNLEYACIVYLNELFLPVRLLRIAKKYLAFPNTKVTKKYLSSIAHDEIDGFSVNLPADAKQKIEKFGHAFCRIVDSGIIRSRKLVADLGEYYASQKLNLTLSAKGNFKGCDAQDQNGTTYEIKTRRVYESGRRESESRRLNGLKDKTADMLVIVALDRAFRCAGMWAGPLSNVKNPKSAHLEIVNTAPGFRSIVPTRISWLRNR